MSKQEGIERYKLGQKVALYGYIDSINIENRKDIENTTTLRIKTPVKTISVNPKYEAITTDLDKPKLVVPQFVASWYEEHKDDLSNAIGDFYIDYINDYFSSTSPESLSGFLGWFSDNSDTAIETLVMMKICGYTIKEKLYTVEIPNNLKRRHNALVRKYDGTIILDYFDNDNWREDGSAHLSEAEIKKDFAFLWQFAVEVN